MSEPLVLDVLSLKKADLYYRAINHKVRQEILQLLFENASMTVSTLYHALSLEQAVVSQHLAILRRAGLVNTERAGKYVFYSVNCQRLKLFQTLACTFSEKKVLESSGTSFDLYS